MSGKDSAMRVLLAIVMMTLLGARVAAACEPGAAREVAGGAYRLHTPSGWDGKAALPALVYFPGYRTSSADVMADDDVCESLSQLGVLLVALEPADGRWDLPAFGGARRDEAAYVAAALDDAQLVAPIDRSRVMAAGFSIGASMVWYLACNAPAVLSGRFAAYGALSGTFWMPQPDHCDGPPFSLIALHGTSDTVFPLHGRSLRGGAMRQGDTPMAIAMLRRHDSCPTAQHRQIEATLIGGASAVCEIDDACAGGKRVRLCIHGGPHEVERGLVKTLWGFMSEQFPEHSVGLPLPLQNSGG